MLIASLTILYSFVACGCIYQWAKRGNKGDLMFAMLNLGCVVVNTTILGLN